MPELTGSLVAAAAEGDTERVAALLRAGADPNAADRDGTTPLYQAAVQGDREVVGLLLEAGADPNAESLGETDGLPLCAAACWGFTDVVRALLAHGADPNRKEDAGTPTEATALAWAGAGGHGEVVGVLLQAGADPNLDACPAGEELIRVQGSQPDGSGRTVERETGHAAIAALLRAWRRP
jgi:ankyrin repeat protein